MSRSLQKTKYTWAHRPELSLDSGYGMYVNIPFCHSLCSFCPFYKTKYDPDLVQRYVLRLCDEIRFQELPGAPEWVYFGGGTPNVLSLDQVEQIIIAITNKVALTNCGIELHPQFLDKEYLQGLASLGFSKLSIGVETLSPRVGRFAKRPTVSEDQLRHIISWAHEKKLFINADLIVGLQQQSAHSIKEDVRRCYESGVDQLTLYPYMVIKGLNSTPGMTPEAQFRLIEDLGKKLLHLGFTRMSPWTFSRSQGEYDCSKAELVNDYVGFGAGSFSTNQNWKIVNPPVELYLAQEEPGIRKALIASKSVHSDQWRLFGKMLADLCIENRKELGQGINAFIHWLKFRNYLKNGSLTEKGIYLAHELMKTIVESLPFPIQNHQQISNESDYLEELIQVKNQVQSGLADSA